MADTEYLARERPLDYEEQPTALRTDSPGKENQFKGVESPGGNVRSHSGTTDRLIRIGVIWSFKNKNQKHLDTMSECMYNEYADTMSEPYGMMRNMR